MGEGKKDASADVLTQVLRQAYLTELQAVSIYQAECWILRHTPWGRSRQLTLRLCEKTLREELRHQGTMRRELADQSFPGAMDWVNQVVGWNLGAALALIPVPKGHWWLHVWAELQAAASYAQALQSLHIRLSPEELRDPRVQVVLDFLREAEANEREHSARFRRFCEKSWT